MPGRWTDLGAEGRKKSQNVKLKCHFSQFFNTDILGVRVNPQAKHNRNAASSCVPCMLQ